MMKRIGILGLLAALTALAAHASSRSATHHHVPPPERPVIEAVFVLDTTGSMSGLIEGAKQKIWSVANQMASGTPTPDVRIGLIGYRDRGDAYVTRRHDLTGDIDAIYARLQAFQAGGGGDTPESVNQALHEAVQHMSWTPGQHVFKVIFLVGDAPPHMDYPGDVPFTRSVALAASNGIVINTVQCGTLQATTPVWQQIAHAASGRYVAIRQDGGMLAMATPHDAELARLNQALGETVVAWGDAGERAEIEAKRGRALAAPEAAAASRLAYLAKTGGKVNSGRADLVDAVKDGTVDPKTLDADVLPAPLRSLAPAEREAFVAEKAEERAKLQREITRVAKKRDAWVAREEARRAAAGEGDGFDQQVLGAIRAQAESKGIVY
ncbi:MAG: vWA domain-containing protein [Myxococcota bacterium]